MKRILIALALIGILCGLDAWPVRIQSWSLDNDIKNLNLQQISISSVNRQTGVILAEVRDAEEEDQIRALGLDAVRLPDLAKEYATQLWEETKDSRDPMRAYYTIDEYHSFMQQTAAQYPSICSLVQYGTSGQGRPLYMMKISDNVNQEENEPELKYVGSIHGNEVVGYDMLIRLIQLLTSEYGSNTRINNIVNNTELWINPMMNPDGYVLMQRYNAAGLDLNRNFPMPNGAQHPDGNAWGVENMAMMDFSNDHDFDLSINFHGGSLVINYPWDYTYTLAPDNDLIREMALTYSRENQPMYNSTEFNQGITNGAAWYVITGSMQDWNYHYTDCIELTAEIGYQMWPPASSLDTFWAQNQESLLQYIEFAQRGVHGTVTWAGSTPLDATIAIAGNAKVMHTDMPLGDYHRLLLPGTYTMTVSATGYISQTQQVVVPETGGVTLNWNLGRAGLTDFRGQVRNAAGAAIANATIQVNTDPVLTATTDVNGLFIISDIYEGSYQVSITAPGYGIMSTSLELDQEDWLRVYVMQAPIFSDNFENGISNWNVTGQWGITSEDGSNVLSDSPSGNYSNYQNRIARLINFNLLHSISNPGVSFRCKYDLEAGYDFVYVEASSNGSNWTQLGSFTGTQSNWTNQYFSLAAYAGGDCHIRFRLSTDSGVTADGIYIDDFQITGVNSSIPIFGDIDNDSVISQNDIRAINAYAVGNDPIPAIDVRPWNEARLNAADADGNDSIDSFDSYLLMKYISEPSYRLPVQSGTPEPVQDPVLTASYNGTLVINLANPQALKSLMLHTSFVDIEQIHHVGVVINPAYDQVFCDDTDTYGYAGYNVSHESLYLTLEPNPDCFTLSYTLNGVPGSVYIDTGSASDDPTVPTVVTELVGNYPNPFNPSTTISYTLAAKAQPVTLAIYNLKGQVVRTLVQGEISQGRHSVLWDGKDNAGQGVSSGIYFARLHTPEGTHVRKLMLSK